MIPIDFGVSRSKAKVTVTLNKHQCPLNNLKPMKLRDTIIGVFVAHLRTQSFTEKSLVLINKGTLVSGLTVLI